MAYARSTRAQLSDADRRSVLGLTRGAESRDGQPPLSDQALARLRSAEVRHLLVHDGSALVGYAQLDGTALELVGEPDAVLELLLDDAEGLSSELHVWSRGRSSRLAGPLAARGYHRERALHQLRLSDLAGQAAPLARGVTVRAFVPGVDELAWLRVNAAAFATHPEQGRWTREDLLAREAEPWFDPAGFLLAVRDTDAALLGFHWTKIHDDGTGEVYVLGIDPAAQGLGLGASLLRLGLDRLRERGCTQVLLYVDGDNRAARALYAGAGFVEHDEDSQWRRRSPAINLTHPVRPSDPPSVAGE